MKILTNAWRLNNKKQFLSVSNVKDMYATELLYMGNIEIPKILKIKYNIKNKNDILNIPDKICSKILKDLGWKWIKLENNIHI